VISERDVDCGQLYRSVRERLIATLREQPEGAWHRAVPATPSWRVADVLAHLVGLVADLNAGRFGEGNGDQWTAAQVAARRDRTVEELVGEWQLESPLFEDGLRLFGYELGCHFLADALAHEADIHHALRRPGLPDDLALAVGLDWYLDVAHRSLREAAMGSVLVQVGGERFRLGPGETVAEVHLGRFEAFRSLGGRRSASQLRNLPWRGDAEPVLAVLSAYPLPEGDLDESTELSGPWQ
jgi:hypothetical protein